MRVSLFFPRSTPFYEGLLGQMLRGFQAAGCEASGLCRHLGAQELRDWCAAHRPHAILEMNRPGRDVPFLPAGVRHIVWVVDFNGRHVSYFEGSDITYLFGPGWVRAYPHRGFHRWLGPGTDPSIYAPHGHGPRFPIEANFAGHIPAPWTEGELDRDLTGGFGAYRFRDLLPALGRWLLEIPKHRRPRVTDSLEAASYFCGQATGYPVVVDERLAYDIRGRTIRQVRRAALVDGILAQCPGLQIYGPPTWPQWPQYAPHYRGQLERPEELSDVYRRSAVTFHEGNGIHFRSIDAMACGALLFFLEHPEDRLPGGIETQFAPGVHYVSFNAKNFPEQIARYRRDKAAANAVRKQALQEILHAHTWRHRAEQVLCDLRDVG